MGDDPNRDLDRFIADFERRQRNIVFPDTVRNERFLFQFLWRGSPTASRVQRAGAFLCGCVTVLISIDSFLMARQDGSRVLGAFALLNFAVACRILYAAWRSGGAVER